MGNRYEYDINVKKLVPPMTLWNFFANVVGVVRIDPSGNREPRNSPVGESRGKDAEDARTKAREKMEKWIAEHGG